MTQSSTSACERLLNETDGGRARAVPASIISRVIAAKASPVGGVAPASRRSLRRQWLAALALLAHGCGDDPAAEAEKRYDIVQRHGSLDEQCSAATEVRDAYLKLNNEKKYQDWTLFARQACYAARMQERFRLPSN